MNVTLARKRRRWLDLTQAEVGRRVGVSRYVITSWEKGRREPSASELVAWAKALELEPVELLTEPEQIEATA
jgi:transcriptional regulator with XRE-family HTH domain